VIVKPANRAPVVLCTNVVKSAGSNCTASVTAQEVDAGTTDPDGDTFTLSLLPAGPFGLGTNAVTLTATDSRGASNSCAATVIVVDTTAPVMECPSNISTQVAPGEAAVAVEFPLPVLGEDCSGASAVCVPASGSLFPLGTNAVVCTATDGAGNTNVCSFDVIVSTADTNVYDLAVVKVKAPKVVKLSVNRPSLTAQAQVTIQNRGPQPVTITNLADVVTLEVLPVTTNCPALTPTLLSAKPQAALPVTLKPGKKLKVYFNVTFSQACLPDLRRSTKQESFDDYRYVATVKFEGINGQPDTDPVDNVCPRAPSAKDKGCAEVITDVFVWYF
jgi:hypothetical protein